MGVVLTDPFGWIGQTLLELLTRLGLQVGAANLVINLLGAVVLGTICMTLGALITWVERKVVARFQDRLGPNRVGPFGLLQPIADGIKLLTKETVTPTGADTIVYNIAPVVMVMSVIGLWAVIPLAPRLIGSDINVGVLYIVSVGGIGTLSIMMAGWASNNKYALLGAFRTVAQLVSYEVPMVLALLIPTLLAGSMGMATIVEQQANVPYIVLAPIAALIFFISSMAEAGKAPFDLLEAESEIVAGYNIEYGGLKFGMFYVGEFLHGFTIAALTAVLFLGGWQGPLAESYPLLGLIYFLAKTSVVYFGVMWVRFSFPRLRIDQLNTFNWKFLTPLSLAVIVVTAVADKWAVQAGLSRVGVLLGANALLVLAIVWLIGAYARSARRRLERTGDKQAAGAHA
ncbi:MAG TPA: NADH-quinone oxidoreductase subunit NuoH [Anaerolineales bacterium]|nr:NADH-quinone oxidoreductase subunit NuoH [Anaerolineales bacterium]